MFAEVTSRVAEKGQPRSKVLVPNDDAIKDVNAADIVPPATYEGAGCQCLMPIMVATDEGDNNMDQLYGELRNLHDVLGWVSTKLEF